MTTYDPTPESVRLVLRSLGAPGVAWVSEQLKTGPPLSFAVAESLSLDSGMTYAYAPQGMDPALLTEFDESVYSHPSAGPSKLGTSAGDALIELARRIGGDLFIAEITLGRQAFTPNETWGESTRLVPERVVFYGELVLPWRLLEEATVEEIGDLTDETGFVTTAAIPALAPLEELTDDVLWTIARGTRSILVPAYDGVSLVLWTSAPLAD